MEKETAQRQQTHERKKGGRPIKRVKRSHTLVVRVTTEWLLITGKAREPGLSVSAWFRAAAKKAIVVARLRPEEAASLRMLSGLANNLNQLTRLAHREGLLTLQGRCRQLLYDIHHILQHIGRDDRKGDDR
ncbi:plasmid mobilization relaxosome protein MobC [Pontibacter sp. HSC-14F20]|uniref:plasmid mobilization protein n=1 Tax=Pontibacter sp. HSC-14F20 TaxID=2864136 RepID=UPI001C72F3B4|nr:plasmid mobilization relaxosome protein MobC [Pontibacter sp. HSC-14F20]MBX0335355.1 plasmid mobilization relaxosome protein MobC [Pontibacter sp. HSC-14F20]